MDPRDQLIVNLCRKFGWKLADVVTLNGAQIATLLELEKDKD